MKEEEVNVDAVLRMRLGRASGGRESFISFLLLLRVLLLSPGSLGI